MSRNARISNHRRTTAEDSADEAFASNEKAADWVRNNVLELTKGMAEIMVGNTLIAEIKEQD
jgi:hypothetical protein